MADWTTKSGVDVPEATPTGAAGLRLKNNFLLLADRALTSVCCGRLTLETGVPIPVSDQAAKTTVYFTPFGGNELALYDASALLWKIHNFNERSVAVPAVKFMPFDVFAYDDAGTVELETVDWDSSQTTGSISSATAASPVVVTSNGHGLSNGDLVGIDGLNNTTGVNGFVWTVTGATANTFELMGSAGGGSNSTTAAWYKVPSSRTTDLGNQDGIYVKSGSGEHRYLGTCSTTDQSGQCEDSVTKRFVWNANNRVQRNFLKVETTLTWTLAANGWRPANNTVGNRLSLVVGGKAGVPEAVLAIDVLCRASTDSMNAAMVGIGEDRTNAIDAQRWNNGAGITSSVQFPCSATLRKMPEPGFHYYQWIERCAGGTATYSSEANNESRLSGIAGYFEM